MNDAIADLRTGALALGALLVLAAVFLPYLAGAVRNRSGSWARVVAGIVGAALLGWGLMSSRGSRSPSQPGPAVTSNTAPSPVDLVDVASVALQDCPRATAPAVPNGAAASREQMAAARSAFQAYDTANNSYVRCVDATVERIARQYAGVASQEELRSLKAVGLGAHNTAIDQEQAIADQFNAQIRAYKSKHPQS